MARKGLCSWQPTPSRSPIPSGAALPQIMVRSEGINFAQAAKLLPRLRAGRPVNAATLFRWHIDGVRLPDGRRLKLGAVRLGNHFATSRAAIERFVVAQNDEPDDAPAPAPRSPGRRQRAADQADAELRRRGC